MLWVTAAPPLQSEAEVEGAEASGGGILEKMKADHSARDSCMKALWGCG